jgi:hypothetical protein
VRTVATAAATPRCADGIVAGLTEDLRIGQLLFWIWPEPAWDGGARHVVELKAMHQLACA